MLYFRQGVVSITDACNYEALPVTHLQGGRRWDPKCALKQVNGNYMSEQYAQEEKEVPIQRGELLLKYSWTGWQKRNMITTDRYCHLFSNCLKINWWLGGKLQKGGALTSFSDSCSFLACCLLCALLSSICVPIGVLALKWGAVRHIAMSREEKGIAPPTKRNPVESRVQCFSCYSRTALLRW